MLLLAFGWLLIGVLIRGASMRKVLLSGYYGFGNAGDEAILAATIGRLRARAPNLSIAVLSKSPDATARSYGVESCDRMSAPAVLRAVHSADLILFGGGSLLQDSTSFRSLMYYLAILRLSRLAGKPVVVYANGIGPLKSGVGRRLSGLSLNRVEAISVRDRASLALLRAIGVTKPIKVTADPAFMLDPAAPARVDELLAGLSGAATSRIVWLALRPVRVHKQFYDSLARAVVFLRQQGFSPCHLSMQQGDEKAAEDLCDVLSARGEPGIPSVGSLTPSETLGVLERGEFCFGMRLHALILAARAALPFIGVEIDPKIGAFCSELGFPTISVQSEDTGIDPEKAIREWIPKRKAMARELEARLPQLISLADENIDLVLEALTGPSKGP